MTKPMIVLAEDEEDIREIYQLLIESEYDVDFKVFEGANPCLSWLKDKSNAEEISSIRLVISDQNMPDGKGELLWEHFKSTSMPFSLISANSPDEYERLSDLPKEKTGKHRYFSKPLDMPDFFSWIEEGQFLIDGEETSKDYKKIKMDTVIRYESTHVDAFLKINDGKFIQIHKKDTPDLEAFHRYKEKGASFIYVKNQDFQSVANGLITAMIKQAKSIKNRKEGLALTTKALELVSDLGPLATDPEEVVELISNCVEACLNTMEDEDTLDIFKGIMLDKGYLMGHAITAMNLTLSLADVYGLTDSEKEILCNACLLHDIALTDVPNLSPVLMKKSSSFAMLKPNEKAHVLNHPSNSSKIIAKTLSGSPGVGTLCTIIQEHHEFPSGEGFPKGLTSDQVHPLTCFFHGVLVLSDLAIKGDFGKDHSVKKSCDELYTLLPDKRYGPFRDTVKKLLEA